MWKGIGGKISRGCLGSGAEQDGREGVPGAQGADGPGTLPTSILPQRVEQILKIDHFSSAKILPLKNDFFVVVKNCTKMHD